MVSEFNEGYPNLFNQESKEDEEEDEESDGDTEDGGSDSEFGKRWCWIALIDKVSDTTKEKWSDVFEMNIRTFLNIVCYTNDKAEYDKQQLEKWKRSH